MSPIVFFGTERYSLIALKTLVDNKLPVVAVVTKPDTIRGRGRRVSAPAVKQFAEAHGIDVWQPTTLSDIIPKLQTIKDPVGVLVAYGKIVPESVIEQFSPGIINLHPSLLPKYRGPSPVESAILNRDAKTGLSLMQLSKEMDAGPVYIQVPYALDHTETTPELYETLFTLGANLLVSKLPDIIDGTIQPITQDHNHATYCGLLHKEDAFLDLTTITPGEAEARIRAYQEFPRTKIKLGAHIIIVTKAHAVMTKTTALDLPCQNGAYLSIDELISPSGRTMTGADFLRGYKV